MTRTIQVWGDWGDESTPFLIGSMSVDSIRGKESLAFTFDKGWLQSPDALSLDPHLQLFEGYQYPQIGEQSSFGFFLDSSPDRWGRMLMQRREAIRARTERRRPKSLMDSDYLLGVHDEQRMGAMRYRLSAEGPFLSAEVELAAPPWKSLRELEQAAWIVQSDSEDKKFDESLRMLLAPGSSLGGARPKAGVVDEHNQLWIAKFPGRNDERNVAAWEILAHTLAQRTGIRVPEARIEVFGKGHYTFLSKRFDRTTRDSVRYRIHFASAMTMLGYQDGTSFASGASYLELAEWIIQNQTIVDEDLEELWRRIVFSILIHNTDDHLRNHGFLLTDNGWRLSPAYDLNPDPHGTGLSLNISELDNSLNLDLAYQVAPHFRVSSSKADAIVAMARDAVSNWKQVAAEIGISRQEQEWMSHAFQVK